MRMQRNLIPLILILAVVAAAAPSPVASVTSTQPFDLNGKLVQVDGVPSWPVCAGDVITTHAAPATVTFRNGATIVIAPNSSLRIETKKGHTFARLLKGSGKYVVGGAVVALTTMTAIELNRGKPGPDVTLGQYGKLPNASPTKQ